MKKIFEGILENDRVEDGGQAVLPNLNEGETPNNGMFVRIQSWDEELKHEEIQPFLGKKVKVTVEVVE
jgi:hypothetical protein